MKYQLSGKRSLDKRDLDPELFNMVLEAAEGAMEWGMLKDWIDEELELDSSNLTPEQYKSIDLAIELGTDAIARVRKAVLNRYH